METIDPATGQPLPQDAIQRILFISNSVHVYNIPPMPSNRGYVAAAWTAEASRHIFTARLRVLETSYDTPSAADGSSQNLKVDLVLEDASTANLFAAAPYTSAAIVESVLDSSRFFAVTVKDPNGRKAVLGIGFEERSEAFDLGVALQEARKALGWDAPAQAKGLAEQKKEEVKDYSLKEGETITVNLGGTKFGRRRRKEEEGEEEEAQTGDLQGFALPPPPPPPAAIGDVGIKPPPSARDVKERRKSARDLGFDDGQFGEFA